MQAGDRSGSVTSGKEQSAGCEIRYDLEEPRKATAWTDQSLELVVKARMQAWSQVFVLTSVVTLAYL